MRSEEGRLQILPDGSQAIVVSGAYQYAGPNKLLHAVKFIADSNGYRAAFSIRHDVDVDDVGGLNGFGTRVGTHLLISLIGA